MSETPNPYDLVIADLENKRDQINAAIEMLRALGATGAIALPLPTSSSKPQQSEADIASDAFFGMTIPEAAKKYLVIVKATHPNNATRSNSELCAALLRGGFKTQANNFGEVVRSTLQRHSDFVKVNGEWGLTDWYGNRGVTRRIKKSPTPDALEGPETEEPSEVRSDGSQ